MVLTFGEVQGVIISNGLELRAFSARLLVRAFLELGLGRAADVE